MEGRGSMNTGVSYRGSESWLNSTRVKDDGISGLGLHWGTYLEQQKEPGNSARGQVTELGAVSKARVWAARVEHTRACWKSGGERGQVRQELSNTNMRMREKSKGACSGAMHRDCEDKNLTAPQA